MRSIRRSLKNDRASPPASAGSATSHTSAHHHVLGSGSADKNGLNGITVSKPGQGKTPPKSVIRAITGYRSRSPQELSFEAGDFFHVVGERGGSDQQPEWFDAANPLTGARGLVPAHCFQVLGRNEKEGGLRIGTAGSSSGGTAGAGASSLSPPGNGTFAGAGQGIHNRTSGGSSTNEVSPASGTFPHRGGTPSGNKPRGKHQPLYGVVQYDFRAERADELDAKKGESIIVIAQSNHEWFVAKPIGRLGGPGLIPVSFVAISDTTTGEPLKPEKVREMVESGMVPPVEEWKKMTAEYKQASIPLGRFDFSGPATPATVNDASHPYGNNAGQAASASSFGSGLAGRPPSGPGQKTFSPESSTSSLQHNRQPSIAQQYLQKHTYSQDNYPGASSSSNHMSQQSDSRRQESSNDSVGGIADQYFQNGEPGSEEGEAGEEDAGAYYEKYGLVTSATVESFHSEEENYWFHLRVNFSQSGYTLILYRLYDDFLEFQYALMDDHPIEAGKAVPEDAPPEAQPNRIIPKMPGPVDFVDEVVCAQRVDDLTVYLKGLCGLPDYMRSSPLFYEFFVPRPGDVEAVVPDANMQARWEAEKARDRERDREMASSAAGMRQRGLDEEVVEYLDKMQVGGSEPGGKAGNLPPLSTTQNGPFAPGYSLSNASQQGQHQRNQSNQHRPPSGYSQQGGPGHVSPTSGSLQDRSGPLSAGSGISFVSPFTASNNQQASTSTTSLSSQGRSTPQSAPPPFVKIKIFHRNTDDLIAIRVPPNIKLDALLDKVRERLGGDVEHVRYRDEGNVRLSSGQAQGALSLPGGTRLIELRDDAELDTWIRAAQRLVAYVD